MTVATVKKHIGQSHDEIWLGNTDLATWPKPYLTSLKTLRLGGQAFDINGDKLPQDSYRPVFIHKSEHYRYDRIMMDRLSKIRQGLIK